MSNPERAFHCWRRGALLAWLLGLGLCHAAGEALWSLRPWQLDDGLPDNNVTGVAQTADGYLWVATHAGLARFDGVRFEPRALPVGSGISNSLVRVLMLGRQDRLWAALEAGGGMVVGFSGAAGEVFTTAQGVPNFKPLVAEQTPDGAVWVSYVDGSVCRFLGGRVTRFGGREGLTGTTGGWLATDSEGRLWFAKAGRVGLFNGERFEAKHNFPGRIVRLGRARDGGIWILAGQELWRGDATNDPVRVAELPAQRPGVEPTTVYEDRNGAVWLGTKAGGLFVWSEGVITAVETTHNDITAVTQDREGNVWVGTEGGGLDRLRHRIVELNGSAIGLPFEVARSLTMTTNGGWAVGANGALARFAEGHWQNVTNAHGWTGARATCVTDDRAGGVWIGTYHAGLWRGQGGQFTNVVPAGGLAGDIVRALFVDRRGDLWLGLEAASCLQRWRAGQLDTFVQPAGSRTIRAIVEDAVGAIWLGTSDGFLLRVNGKELADDTHRALQPTKPIRALHATADGSVWIGYAGAGVGWLRPNRFHRFGTEQGLLDNYICGIESDEGGALWFTAGHGVFQVRRREFEQVAEGRGKRVLAVDFGRDEGLLNLQGSYGYWPATGRGPDGRLWFGTRSGLVAVRPDRVQPNRFPPVVLIERLLVDGREQPLPAGGQPVRLPPAHRKLELEFTAFNFAAPESLLFQHRLEGWDEAFSEPRPVRSAAFPRLTAGRYEFQVAARNAAGVWNYEGARLRFEVEPFLWQRWWFRLVAVAGFTAAIIAVVRYVSFRRLRTRVQRLEQEAALARDRARIAQDLHDDLGANLTQIALLSELAQNDYNKPDEARGHIDRIFQTARALTRSLDEIVWAVNPKNDSLDRFVAHLCTYAPEFLRSAGVRCRLNVPVDIPAINLASDVRHHLHLAVKEALHNVAKHAGATEVRLQMQLTAEQLVVTITDDGTGLAHAAADGQDGLANLARRMRDIGGRFESGNAPGRGTVITFTVPLRAPVRAKGGAA